MWRVNMKVFCFICILIFLNGCSKLLNEDIERSNDKRLVLRNLKVSTSAISSERQLNDQDSSGIENKILFIEYIAKLDPPKGTLLQATDSLIVSKDKLLVVYNKSGEEVGGAIDLLDFSHGPKIIDTIITDSIEFALIHNFRNFILYGGQCLNKSTGSTSACIVASRISGNKIKFLYQIELSSYYVTGIASYGDLVFVTTGDQGHLYIFDAIINGNNLQLTISDSIAFDNILDLKFDVDHLKILYGRNSLNLLEFDYLNKVSLDEQVLSNEMCFAPTKMEIVDIGTLVNSCSDALVHIADREQTHYPVENNANGLTKSKEHILLSQGEAGLCSMELKTSSIVKNGCFDFMEDSGSANNIKINMLADGQSLFVLSDGLGGTKFLKDLGIVDPEEPVTATENSFYGLGTLTSGYFQDGSPISDELGDIYELRFSEFVDFIQLDPSKAPLGNKNRILFHGRDNYLISKDKLLEDNRPYWIEIGFILEALPTGISNIFSTNTKKGMRVLLNADGKIYLNHDGVNFLGSDVNIKIGEEYLLEIFYDPNGKSYMKINDFQVGVSISHPAYEGGKLIIGSYLDPSINGEVKRFYFSNKNDYGELILWAKENMSLFSPYETDIDLSGELVLWMDATKLDSIYLDGDKVIEWQDLSSSNCNFSNPKEKFFPRYEAGTILFEGKQFLECTKSNVLGGGAYTKVAVVEFMALNKKNNILSSGVGNAHALYMGDSAYPQMWHSHYRFNYSQGPVTLSTKVIILASYGNGLVENLVYLNKELSASTPDERLYDDPKLEIGSHGGGNFLHGKIYEIKVYNKSLNSIERESVLSDLILKHGIN